MTRSFFRFPTPCCLSSPAVRTFPSTLYVSYIRPPVSSLPLTDTRRRAGRECGGRSWAVGLSSHATTSRASTSSFSSLTETSKFASCKFVCFSFAVTVVVPVTAALCTTYAVFSVNACQRIPERDVGWTSDSENTKEERRGAAADGSCATTVRIRSLALSPFRMLLPFDAEMALSPNRCCVALLDSQNIVGVYDLAPLFGRTRTVLTRTFCNVYSFQSLQQRKGRSCFNSSSEP